MTNDVKISNGTWTDESLPSWRRKELLQEDLRQFRVRKASRVAGTAVTSQLAATPGAASSEQEMNIRTGDAAPPVHPEAPA